MFRPLVPDRKLAQQRRQMIDQEFKKETVQLSNTAIRKAIKASKMRRQSSARRKQQSIQPGLNLVHCNKARPQSSHSYWHQYHLCDEVAKISEDRAQYPMDNQVSNKIGNKGCKYLSKMISPTLNQLYLSISVNKQTIIRLIPAVFHIFPKANGRSQNPSSFVNNKDNIDHNRIGEQGIENLLKAGWPSIKRLHLCWLVDTQAGMKFKDKRKYGQCLANG